MNRAPTILFVPKGIELDSWSGKTFASMVGFLFLDTRIWGVAIPFIEISKRSICGLRSLSRRGGRRRGVVFVKEIVPRLAIALTARWLYNENYVALPTGHEILRSRGETNIESAKYYWTSRQRTQFIELATRGERSLVAEGSQEEFISQHYWGYSSQRDGGTVEYRVEHAPWRIWQTESSGLHCDVEDLYGKAFMKALSARPSSAFLAEGSPVTVYRGRRIR